ncbi:MAG TPA: hypothetical protein VLA61_05490 [Ideonella sp.]|uniref:hypothetical protein n=1 Tax=Ideonella sp. TaxID=1929293 RepID=UPI002C9A8CF9|nr:hypothetical protein [Ideonella sp.]HSI47698.1 hypothetical protein [Ideonella sp.]
MAVILETLGLQGVVNRSINRVGSSHLVGKTTGCTRVAKRVRLIEGKAGKKPLKSGDQGSEIQGTAPTN